MKVEVITVSEMSEEIDKLIFIYDLKIDDCDKVITHLTNEIRKVRRGSGSPEFLEQNKKDRAIEQAKKQSYVQAKYDIDSLIDYLPSK